MSRVHLLGIYDEAPKAAGAAKAARALDLGEVTAYSPAPNHLIDAALDPGVSAIRTFALVGGILGLIVGFALPIFTALDEPIITGGKPIISIPAIAVVAFEMTILLAALGAIGGFLLLSGLPLFKSTAPYDPRCSEDRWGVLITCAADQEHVVRAKLKETGAQEVQSAKA